MGVTGSGKSTVGKILASQLAWKFVEGDDFHSPKNIEKMRRGEALNDADRSPWLEAIREVMRTTIERGEDAIIACSALKEYYSKLLQNHGQVSFVYLTTSMALIQDRLKNRVVHFMNPDLIQSQFDTLEEPEKALQIDASSTPAEIVQVVRNRLAV